MMDEKTGINRAQGDSDSLGRDQKLAEEHGDLGSPDFPEGGLRAWLVVSGSAATMFCTFGYLTGFG